MIQSDTDRNIRLTNIDGDQVTVEGIYSEEANKEIEEFMKSPKNLLGLDGSRVRTTEKEAIQTMYNLTKVLDADKDKITDPVF